jgi:endonuclease YncB( thermonuclease family)
LPIEHPWSAPTLPRHSRIFFSLVASFACAACTNSPESSRRSLSSACPVGAISGTSDRVTDGDTFKLKDDAGAIIIIRLDQIDAPEKRQPWGNRSKRELFQLLNQKQLCVIGKGHDRYGRLIGDVRAGDVLVNREMIRAGAAWAYRKYLRDQGLVDLEATARTSKRGLWSLPASQTTPPWEFRHAKGQVAGSSPLPAFSALPLRGGAGNDLSCPMKPTCREMTSCEEAKGWLVRCGGDGIDGDRDGIPCEKLCGSR